VQSRLVEVAEGILRNTSSKQRSPMIRWSMRSRLTLLEESLAHGIHQGVWARFTKMETLLDEYGRKVARREAEALFFSWSRARRVEAGFARHSSSNSKPDVFGASPLRALPDVDYTAVPSCNGHAPPRSFDLPPNGVSICYGVSIGHTRRRLDSAAPSPL
jgi:hypothetical protein